MARPAGELWPASVALDGEYVVLSRWETKEAFSSWVNSDLFKMSHRHANGELHRHDQHRRPAQSGH